MTDLAPLKLADFRQQDAIALERRRHRRNRIAGRVTAVRATPDAPKTHTRICPLQLLNISDTGMAALAQEPVPPDTSIVIFFPPHGPEGGFDKYGRVVRTRKQEYGHEIAIQFNTPNNLTRNAC